MVFSRLMSGNDISGALGPFPAFARRPRPRAKKGSASKTTIQGQAKENIYFTHLFAAEIRLFRFLSGTLQPGGA
jgi:hypothetical protein